MRTLAKYVLLMSAAVGVAWASVSVEIDGRTPYGHFRAAGGGAWMEAVRSGWLSARESAVAQWDAWRAPGAPETATPKAPAPKRARPAPRKDTAPPKVQESKGARRRVAILQKAAEAAEAPEPRRRAPTRTRVDAPMSKGDRAALDRVVSGR